MKRIFLLLTVIMAAILPVAVTASSAPKGTPDITFDRTSHDFGSISESGKPVTATFRFKNTGDAPLLIVTASASCGCTKPEFSPEPVMPGQENEISVTFDPKGKRGEFDKTVTVRTNIKAKRKVVLHLTGVVLPPHK